MERNFKFPAFRFNDGRVIVEGCFMKHQNVLLATPREGTVYNVQPPDGNFRFKVLHGAVEEVDLMDYPKLVPHMIGVVRDKWLHLHHKNQVFKWLLTKGISEANADYACETVNKEAKEWYLKFLKDRGRLW